MTATPIHEELPATTGESPWSKLIRNAPNLQSGRRPIWQVYALTVAATGSMFCLRLALDGPLGGRPTLVMFILPIMLSAYVGGLGAGLLATLLSYASVTYYVLPPAHSFRISSSVDQWQVAIGLVAGVFISLLSESLHRTRRRAERATAQLQFTQHAGEHAEQGRQASEGRYLTLFDHAPDGIVIADPQGRATDANPSMCRMFGYTRDELIGLHASDIVAAAELEVIKPAMDKIHSRSAYQREWQFRQKDGTPFSADVTATLMPDGNLMAVVRDITERNRTEARFRRLMESNAQGVMFWNSAGEIFKSNDAFLKIIGYSNEDQENGLDWRTLTPPEYAVADHFALEQFAAKGFCAPYEKEFIRKDGSRVPVLIGAAVFEDNNEEGVCFVLDRSDRQQAESTALQLAAMVESLSDAVIGMDRSGTITSWNASAKRIFGFTREEALGRSIYMMVPPDLVADETELRAKVGRGEQVEHYETVRLRKDRVLIDVSVSITAIRDSKGRLIGSSKVARDITERKRAESALREGEDRFRTMANSIPQLAWIGGPDGAVHWYNERWYAYTGKSLQEMEGWGWQSVHDPERLPAVMERWQAAIESASPFEMEFPIRGADGKFRTFLTRVQPMKDAGGRVVQWFGTNTDVETLKQAEEQVRCLNADLEQRVAERTAQLQSANKELEAFSYAVSHDLRAPLRSLDGFSQALLEDYGNKLGEDGQDYLRRIRGASQRMGHLIDDLLNLSRLTRSDMHRRSVDLSRLAKEVIDDLRAGDPARKVTVHISEGLVAEGDADLLRIALTNLIGNAWKFSGKRDGALIEVGRRGEDGENAFFVRDNGVGFDMAYATNLFGAFQRLHAMEEFPGTGIGLVTVQRIIHRHGGKIWAESAPGLGAAFNFTL